MLYLSRPKIGSIEDILFPAHLDGLVDSFILGLKNESKFRDDTKWHDDAPKRLYQRVFSRINSISPHELKNSLDENLMLKHQNKQELFRQIDEDFDKFRRVLKFIREFKGDPVVNINKLLDKKGDLHLERGGIFFVTQLLAVDITPLDHIIISPYGHLSLKSTGVFSKIENR